MNLQDNISFLKHQLKNTTELLEKAEAEQAKELAKPKSKRGLRDSRSSYGLDSLGNIFQYFDGDLGVSNDNAFIDQESAQLQAQRNTLVYRMRVAAAECPVDWSDENAKFYPKWLFLYNMYQYVGAETQRDSQLPHFSCEFKLITFMKSLSTDEQKLLICGVE